MRFFIPLLASLAVAAPAVGQPPSLLNAAIIQQPAGPNLESTVRGLAGSQVKPAWLGYAVSMIEGWDRGCCSSGFNRWECNLEGRQQGQIQTAPPRSRINLEDEGVLLVLFRVEEKQVGRIRTFSAACEIDAGGLTMHWLAPVSSSQSIALLTTFISQVARAGASRQDQRLAESAIAAIALHRDPSAVDTLTRTARTDPNRQLRSQALFWLSQAAGSKIAGVLTQAIEQDPEVEVKKRAVFALSQLPKAEGIPLLIQLARTNKIPAVRRDAIFWLGQSNDPRALDFFEEILRSR